MLHIQLEKLKKISKLRDRERVNLPLLANKFSVILSLACSSTSLKYCATLRVTLMLKY